MHCKPIYYWKGILHANDDEILESVESNFIPKLAICHEISNRKYLIRLNGLSRRLVARDVQPQIWQRCSNNSRPPVTALVPLVRRGSDWPTTLNVWDITVLPANETMRRPVAFFAGFGADLPWLPPKDGEWRLHPHPWQRSFLIHMKYRHFSEWQRAMMRQSRFRVTNMPDAVPRRSDFNESQALT